MLGEAAGAMLKEMHEEDTADTLITKDYGHWTAEKNSKEFVEAVLNIVFIYKDTEEKTSLRDVVKTRPPSRHSSATQSLRPEEL